MKYEKGDILVGQQDYYGSGGHVIKMDAIYLVVKSDDSFASIERCSGTTCGGCHWANVKVGTSRLLEPAQVSQEELDKAIPMPAPEEVAVFASQLVPPRGEV